jgi:hypothetical protein
MLGEYPVAVRDAVTEARATKETRYVIQMDQGDGRAFTFCDEQYLDGPEYNAFDGVVWATVFPDGEICRE